MTEQQATAHSPVGDAGHQNIDTASDRARIEAAAVGHSWDAAVDCARFSEYRKGVCKLHIYWLPDGADSVRDATYYRGDIGLAYLAPSDGAADAAVAWLSGRQV